MQDPNEASSPFVLYVNGADSGHVYAPSPIDMQMIIFCTLKADHNNLDYQIVPISKSCPSESFKNLGTQLILPTFSNPYKTYQNIEDIIYYFNFHFDNPDLSYDDSEAANVTKNLLINFCHFIKNYPSEPLAKLTRTFANMEKRLSANGTKYLTSNYLTLLDCNILPKLYHLVVSLKMFLNTHILENYPAVARYLANGFSQTAVSRVCPSNNGIFAFWKDKVNSALVTRDVICKYINNFEKMHETREYL